VCAVLDIIIIIIIININISAVRYSWQLVWLAGVCCNKTQGVAKK